ncbi:hypothetical protein Esi_0348_0018 [Ectocarpus siliculosus]|uniref:Uncharacterized protein n=1 Tax=Ectocarpus siliculosus TaxID=2880 RepID=D7FYN4_ECTSI|nr:hypothetical protein Esi_0348_0018 [Ectocarpus siliculosus]|eukprot:CBJ32576.1 hypothetical protein Esi_0348_0018 [Ectocarpus siliculosus]
MTNGIGERGLQTTVEYAVVPGQFSRWVAVRGHTNEILGNLGVVEMTAGSSSKTCLESIAKVVTGFQPVDKYDNKIKISSISEHPEVGIEGDDQSTIQLVQQASGPFCLKKLKEGDLFKFPAGFNVSGGPGKVSLVIRKPRTVTASGGLGSPHKASALYLPVLLKAGLPGKVLIRRELDQDEFSENITISEPGGFEISDLEVRLEDAAGNRASLTPGGVKVQVADTRHQRLLAECKTADSSFTMPMFTLPHEERRESVTLQVRVEAECLGRVQQAFIEWNREKTNAVTHVHMAAYSPGLAFECEKGMDDNYAVEVERRVDSPLPTLLVWVDTENNIGFLPSAESFVITMTKEGSPICSYEEKRYEQPHSTEEVEMIMRAVPGDPSTLKPTRDPFPESLSASNAHDVGAHRRLLENFEIRVVDRKDNVVGESFNGPVRMQIKASDGLLVAPSDMPQLENASNGILTAERIGAGGFRFKDVSLQAGVGSTEGTYRVLRQPRTRRVVASQQ